MIRFVTLLVLVVACGDDAPPSCADVGCPANTHPFLVCRGLAGPCQCPQDGGEKIECARGSSAP